ncbi:peroxiredoxin, subfamily [Limihaloglobus sulfuriphilus]|uniref:Peroxiredoxin, subfamily n=1 Tax=Limihaloglobus sulfuriphilus TaxID=1851148 RepID=A0A1Q2MHP9_9BACT|nr:OsmC family protein [Limihaloglobus sulfuriphilus]AQQ71782.1 peroxiredoxin, subfamily [Limihaloglobus sulfuriphilus]
MELFKNTITKNAREKAMTSMSGIDSIAVGAPVEYGGSRDTLNPEELFVASINSCIMLVFFHFLDKFKIEILSYKSNAEGTVEKTKQGLRFTSVSVVAEVEALNSEFESKIRDAANLAEKYCLVSNSVSCPVEYSVSLTFPRQSR